MKILSIKLINYIGIYNGMGLNEIYIDFTKGVHKNIVIKGKNGSGKSTLIEALNPLPETNNKFIPKVQAEKHLSYLQQDVIYNIKIIHGIKDNGDRDTTKAYITKINSTTKEQEELNTNGNIGTYKDILFSEFNLDPNFVSLTQLSGTNRGLADMTPSNRKKFISSIIDNLEVYNNIYKIMTKRSSVFKSMINSLISKINSIGDEEKVKLSLSSIEDRLNKLFSEKDKIIEQLAQYKSKIQILDPDCSIQNIYDNIYKDLVELDKITKENTLKRDNIYNKLNISIDISHEDVLKQYNSIKDSSIKLESSIQFQESRINSLLLDRENEAKDIQIKTEKLNSLKNEKNYIDIEHSLKESEKKINEYKNIISMIGLKDIFNISKEEFILGLNTLKDIKETIDVFKSNIDYTVLQSSITYLMEDKYPDINNIDKQIENISISIKNKEIEFQEYELLNKISSKLQLRPSNCTIDSCEFIKDALESFNKKPEENLKILSEELNLYTQELSKLSSTRQEYLQISEYLNLLKVLTRTIEKNSLILNKLPINNIFSDRKLFLDKILNHYHFDEIDILYQYLQYANIIEEYKNEISIYNILQNDYQIYKSKNNILDELLKDIDSLNTKLNTISKGIEDINSEILLSKQKLSSYKSYIIDYEILINILNDNITITRNKNDLVSKYNNIKSNIIIIKECMNNIELMNSSLDNINKQINPLIDDRDTLKHGLLMLEEYKNELIEYNSKYEKIETLKKYSSPSKGIQTLYMSLYMNKTLSMANELLGLLFNGEYVIDQYIINESEFRIPCIGGRIINDDISSMSTGQICLISMILSFVLLQQSSTKYNIIKLDEIDGGLDNNNRILFLQILDKLINMMDTEQCFLISHNNELDLTNCDVILLPLPDNEYISSGNVIYSCN